ncbi:MAG: terminase small subunit [Oscillospiraceae bacterium]
MANEKALEAEQLYKAGKSLVDIAATLGVSDGTVRSWKNRYKWGATQRNNTTQRKRNVATKAQRPSPAAVDVILVEAVEENTSLTDSQKAFCVHYAKTFNATASYLRAYPDCTYNTANTEGPKLLVNPCVREEIQRLKKMRNLNMLASGDDVVEKYMHIAFADMTDFVEWGRYEAQIMGPFGPITEKDEETGKDRPLTQIVNDVRFVDSSRVDGSLVSEVKKGKDGAGLKLADRMKALDWLTRYFELNPADRHRKEFDTKRLELEALKLEATQKTAAEDTPQDDGFISALQTNAGGLWGAGPVDDSHDDWTGEDDEHLDES